MESTMIHWSTKRTHLAVSWNKSTWIAVFEHLCHNCSFWEDMVKGSQSYYSKQFSPEVTACMIFVQVNVKLVREYWDELCLMCQYSERFSCVVGFVGVVERSSLGHKFRSVLAGIGELCHIRNQYVSFLLTRHISFPSTSYSPWPWNCNNAAHPPPSRRLDTHWIQELT